MPIIAIAARFAKRAGATQEPWYKSLGRVRDADEEKDVAKAIAEWADGDTVAAHIAYQIDYLCTGDQASQGWQFHFQFDRTGLADCDIWRAVRNHFRVSIDDNLAVANIRRRQQNRQLARL